MINRHAQFQPDGSVVFSPDLLNEGRNFFEQNGDTQGHWVAWLGAAVALADVGWAIKDGNIGGKHLGLMHGFNGLMVGAELALGQDRWAKELAHTYLEVAGSTAKMGAVVAACDNLGPALYHSISKVAGLKPENTMSKRGIFNRYVLLNLLVGPLLSTFAPPGMMKEGLNRLKYKNGGKIDKGMVSLLQSIADNIHLRVTPIGAGLGPGEAVVSQLGFDGLMKITAMQPAVWAAQALDIAQTLIEGHIRLSGSNGDLPKDETLAYQAGKIVNALPKISDQVHEFRREVEHKAKIHLHATKDLLVTLALQGGGVKWLEVTLSDIFKAAEKMLSGQPGAEAILDASQMGVISGMTALMDNYVAKRMNIPISFARSGEDPVKLAALMATGLITAESVGDCLTMADVAHYLVADSNEFTLGDSAGFLPLRLTTGLAPTAMMLWMYHSRGRDLWYSPVELQQKSGEKHTAGSPSMEYFGRQLDQLQWAMNLLGV
jgi:hypothetical protein